jgi:cytochrome c oxidase assembly protein subunit 15
MQTFIKRLAVVTAIGMFIVLIQGSMVTTTGSAEGCGQSWPLCNGKFVPSYALESMIEYSHRFVVGIISVMITIVGLGALRYWRDRLEIKVFVGMMVAFIVIQSALGAAAVMWPQTPEIMALHFGISLIAFASVLLTAIFLYERDGRDKLRDVEIPRNLRLAVWGLMIYSYLAVYIGAYVRHKDASLACTDWPLCNGSVFPGFTGPVGIVFTHRITAALILFGVAGIIYWTMKYRESRPDLYRASLLAAVFVVLQGASGAVVVWSQLDFYATMSHGMFVSLYFGALAYMCFHVLPRPEAARESTPAIDRQRAALPAD